MFLVHKRFMSIMTIRFGRLHYCNNHDKWIIDTVCNRVIELTHFAFV